MRISDWSSDVCSSDLPTGRNDLSSLESLDPMKKIHTYWRLQKPLPKSVPFDCRRLGPDIDRSRCTQPHMRALHANRLARYLSSDERPVGNDGVSTFNSWWASYN